MIFSKNLKWFQPLIVLLILSHLIGCSKLQLLQKPFEESITEEHSDPLLVKLKNGQEHNIYRAKIEVDSLHGKITVNSTRTINDMKMFLILLMI